MATLLTKKDPRAATGTPSVPAPQPTITPTSNRGRDIIVKLDNVPAAQMRGCDAINGAMYVLWSDFVSKMNLYERVERFFRGKEDVLWKRLTELYGSETGSVTAAAASAGNSVPGNAGSQSVALLKTHHPGGDCNVVDVICARKTYSGMEHSKLFDLLQTIYGPEPTVPALTPAEVPIQGPTNGVLFVTTPTIDACLCDCSISCITTAGQPVDFSFITGKGLRHLLDMIVKEINPDVVSGVVASQVEKGVQAQLKEVKQNLSIGSEDKFAALLLLSKVWQERWPTLSILRSATVPMQQLCDAVRSFLENGNYSAAVLLLKFGTPLFTSSSSSVPPKMLPTVDVCYRMLISQSFDAFIGIEWTIEPSVTSVILGHVLKNKIENGCGDDIRKAYEACNHDLQKMVVGNFVSVRQSWKAPKEDVEIAMERSFKKSLYPLNDAFRLSELQRGYALIRQKFAASTPPPMFMSLDSSLFEDIEQFRRFVALMEPTWPVPATAFAVFSWFHENYLFLHNDLRLVHPPTIILAKQKLVDRLVAFQEDDFRVASTSMSKLQWIYQWQKFDKDLKYIDTTMPKPSLSKNVASKMTADLVMNLVNDCFVDLVHRCVMSPSALRGQTLDPSASSTPDHAGPQASTSNCVSHEAASVELLECLWEWYDVKITKASVSTKGTMRPEKVFTEERSKMLSQMTDVDEVLRQEENLQRLRRFVPRDAVIDVIGWLCGLPRLVGDGDFRAAMFGSDGKSGMFGKVMQSSQSTVHAIDVLKVWKEMRDVHSEFKRAWNGTGTAEDILMWYAHEQSLIYNVVCNGSPAQQLFRSPLIDYYITKFKKLAYTTIPTELIKQTKGMIKPDALTMNEYQSHVVKIILQKAEQDPCAAAFNLLCGSDDRQKQGTLDLIKRGFEDNIEFDRKVLGCIVPAAIYMNVSLENVVKAVEEYAASRYTTLRNQLQQTAPKIDLSSWIGRLAIVDDSLKRLVSIFVRGSNDLPRSPFQPKCNSDRTRNGCEMRIGMARSNVLGDVIPN